MFSFRTTEVKATEWQTTAWWQICTVSQKNIPDIFNINLKTNYQILTIFGFPPHPTFISALPGENKTSEISLLIQYDMIAWLT